MKALISLGLLFLIASPRAMSQKTPDELIRDFFALYEENKPAEAIDLLYSTNSEEWLEQIQDNINQVKSKFQDLQQIVGTYYGHEKLNDADLGSCFKTIIYLVKYDRQPIRFIFQYYKPQKDWRLYGFSYDDNILDDHEELLKQKLVE
ncbi:hypothetical protein [Flavilitoribacter nigricans]|uniref:DUF3887 domain-containing protein n=1 Tax=Flavilitoribacter nigricans (strain ATCC 23147 / DSM 23189 / NBRC 102662 / NCIMB 1420 / SS-2) TaxID=1122177 RepID=A0A2D0NJD4_FLAN2|nr:hypothetical protein [Flavilitoribacter nigricans]PHN07853.1 hypothetical protein CRP01_03635 [Flavilitoribacter nigricans DSM 23189 = NBRC 102662]